jgi:glycosyltransferase involved in cell wall biosynthesis
MHQNSHQTMDILVSFIIPSYKQVDFLGQALASIGIQGLEVGSYEIIVIDGNSNDGTKEFLENNPAISYWESVPDRGQGHALNKALSRAKGKFIGWLNADDYYYPNSVNKALSALENQPDLDLVYGQCVDVDVAGNFIRKAPVIPWSSASLIDACIIAQPACFFRTSFAKKNGPLREDLHVCLDYEYWLRAMNWISALYIPEILAANRIHKNAKSSRLRIYQMIESARVVRAYTHKWNSVWLLRIASAQARNALKPLALSKTFFRPLLSFILFYCIQVWMRLTWKRWIIGKQFPSL